MSKFKVSTGFSDNEDPYDAGLSVSEQLNDLENPELVYIFSSEALANEELLRGINENLDECLIVGSSTGGEIHSTQIGTGGVVAMAIQGDDLELGVGVGRDISEDNYKAGMSAAGKALDDLGQDEHVTRKLERDGIEWHDKKPVSFSVLSTTLTGNGSEVMRGVQDVLGAGADLAGGMAGDDWKLNETYVYFNDELLTDAIVVVGMETDAEISHGVRHGLERSDEVYKVTSSEDNIVKELGGEPAADVYEDLYGPKGRTANFIMTKPLGIETGEAEPRLRDPLDVQDDGSIVYAAEVQEGSRVYVMESPADKMIDAAKEAALEARAEAGNPSEDRIKGAIMYDCVCRWNCFKNEETRRKEIEAVKGVVGEETPIVGWYTYGEIALPRALGGVHNQTQVIQLFVDEE